ncbi:MAG TPA: hypothetical protein VID47_17095 [Actinomycetota bacterium]
MKRIAMMTLALASMVVFATNAVNASTVHPAKATSHRTAQQARVAKAEAVFSHEVEDGYHEPICQSHLSLCADTYDTIGEDYVGHDEPSVLFKSDEPGSGNDVSYDIRLPKDPPGEKPQNDGTGGVWNFELRPTFWFGMTLCDSESAPEYTHDKCVADTDANDFDNPDPNAPDYIGKHPGNAYMELQFYGPGYVPQFTGFGCAAHKYCAAMTIDSLNFNSNTNKLGTADCFNYILGGEEPINWAYLTTSGESQAPANPLHTGTFSNPNLDAVTPDYSKDLLMGPGDRIHFRMHDTPDGLQIDMDDLTNGQSGSMTASIANGFGHILYRPGSKTCKMKPYAFHPMYSTGMPRGNSWSAHTYNIAYSDEIGHFEHCTHVDEDFNCDGTSVDDPGGIDEDQDNNFCVPASLSTVVRINGCFFDDEDFDGPSYQNDWPGTNPDPAADHAKHMTPVLFSSARTNDGRDSYPTVAFEDDLPRIEASDSQFNPPFCDRSTGDNCVNPPAGAQFYPFYAMVHDRGGCKWAEGGPYIQGADYSYGSSSAEQAGALLSTFYPAPGGVVYRYNNFTSGDMANACS